MSNNPYASGVNVVRSQEIHRLEKYLVKKGNTEFKPRKGILVISDSKGRYLKNHVQDLDVDPRLIKWHYKSGRSGLDGLKYIKENLGRDSSASDGLVVFWHGTCDVSTKLGRYIFPRYKMQL